MLEIIIAIVVIGGGGWLLVWVFKKSSEQERDRTDKELVASRAFARENGFRVLSQSEWAVFHAQLEPYAGLGKLDTTGGMKTVFSSSRGPDIIAVSHRETALGSQYLIEQSGIRAQQSGDHLVWTALLAENPRPVPGELLVLPKVNAFSAHMPRQGDWREMVLGELRDKYNCFAKDGYQIPERARSCFSRLVSMEPPPSIHLRGNGVLVYYELTNNRPNDDGAYRQLAQLTESLCQTLAIKGL